MAVASLVLGIVSLVLNIIFGTVYGVGILTSLVGVVLGAMARKDLETKGMATAGMVCSIIALVLGILVFIACIACASAIASSGYYF